MSVTLCKTDVSLNALSVEVAAGPEWTFQYGICIARNVQQSRYNHYGLIFVNAQLIRKDKSQFRTQHHMKICSYNCILPTFLPVFTKEITINTLHADIK